MQNNQHPQYQSFPSIHGDSDSSAKLKALRLPLMVGARFLDIGCNEGFFCGYAKFAGAVKVVGLDHSAHYIERASARFPTLEFIHQSWDTLPKGPFDLILLASSLHYAANQSDLIGRAINELSLSGTLVLELGIAEGKQCEWIEIDRGSDRRLFPTLAKLTEVLRPYAWKIIGNSVKQKGDPVPRFVVHINRRKPLAYLLMQQPGFGKTTIARELFKAAGVPIVGGDQVLLDIASGVVPAEDTLKTIVVANCTASSLDETLLDIVKAGVLPDLVSVWLERAAGLNFALDFYIPEMYWEEVKQILSEAGYLVVQLNWARPGAELMDSAKVANMADAFVAELAFPAEAPALQMPFTGTLGAVVQLGVNTKVMDVTGWAVHQDGFMPKLIGIKLGKQMTFYEVYDRVSRPQVQDTLKLPHSMYGFRICHELPPDVSSNDAPYLLEVYGGNEKESLSGPFTTAALFPSGRLAST